MKINAMNAGKKEHGKELGPIKAEVAQLQKEIDDARNTLDSKAELREDFDKQLDRLSDKRKKERDDRDKLFKMKDEVKDAYYATMIDYSKQQILIKDINWMNGIRQGLLERKEKRDKVEAEKTERAERRRKEAEERDKARQERLAKDEERKAKEEENAQHAEENATKKEINELLAKNKEIADESIASNPFADQILQCDSLAKYCQKHMGNEGVEETKESEKKEQARASGLEDALRSGKLIAAPSKQEKEDQGMFGGLAGKKKGKGRKQHA